MICNVGVDMICGVGTDIIETSRFDRIYGETQGGTGGGRFLTRCFTEDEQAYLRGRPVQTMAGLFAAKEAVVKALGTGFRGFWPREVEITHNQMGQPAVTLRGTAACYAAERGIARVHISISHNRSAAVAFAVAVYARPVREPV